jgi:NTE family protein
MSNAPFIRPTGLVLSAGGERVVAWQVGVLAGLADAGLDPRRATRIVGTSAGALVAARLAGGIDPRADAARLSAGGRASTARWDRRRTPRRRQGLAPSRW